MPATIWSPTPLIRDNIFRDNGGGMLSYYRIHKGKAKGLMPIRDILIENNVFKDTGPSTLSNCQDVRIVGNKFESGMPLRIESSHNMTIENNSFDSQEMDAVKIGEDAKNVVKNGNVFGKR